VFMKFLISGVVFKRPLQFHQAPSTSNKDLPYPLVLEALETHPCPPRKEAGCIARLETLGPPDTFRRA
jgi:hypothetical protein